MREAYLPGIVIRAPLPDAARAAPGYIAAHLGEWSIPRAGLLRPEVGKEAVP